MSDRRVRGSQPLPDRAPSFLEPEHRIDRYTTVRVDRRVHGTNNEIGGTAAYKYGMDVLFTVRCEVCRADVEGSGTTGGRGDADRRVHYDRADPDAWWRIVLQMVELHRQTDGHARAVAASGRGPGSR